MMMRRGHPGLAMATGAMVGAAAARNRAEREQQQAMYQQQQQAQLAQANAEAEAARQAASQASQPAAVAYATTATAVTAAPAVAVQASPAPAEVGRSMLNQALSSGNGESVEDLVALKKQLNVVQMMCDQALQLYQQSLQLNKQAQRSNMVGAVVSVGGPRRPTPMDMAMDAKRDAETKKAIAPAEKASAMLVDGFKKIPDALRLRYPSEMSRVGNIPPTSLAVGSFGRSAMMGLAFGQTGQNLNDLSMAKKISENERELGNCIRVVNEQKQLMAIVQARLDQDIQNAQRSAGAAPAQAAPIAAAVAAPPAFSPPPPPAMAPATFLQLVSAHIVDEHNPAIQQHQIISVPAGATVKLVRGNLSGGLGAPYQDYIEVEYNGRVGKISRLIVQPAGSGVPAALGVPQALY